LDNSNADVSAQVARGLAFAACLPEDMKQWAGTQPGPAFRQITQRFNDGTNFLPQLKSFLCILSGFSFFKFPNLFYFLHVHFFIQATQGVMSMEARVYRLTEKLQKSEAEHEKSMSEVLKVAGENYARLEGEHHKNVITMKEAEERARTEETKRAEAEAEITKIQEKMKELESECVRRLGIAHKEGMEEGLKKGKELGKEGAMGEVATQFKLVYNSGFRHGWKSALSKTEQPEDV
jgi:multidrug efflux pump subunit AcrB